MTDREAPVPVWMRVFAYGMFVAAGVMVLGWIVIFPARLGILVHPPLWYEILTWTVVAGVMVAGHAAGLRADGLGGNRRIGGGSGILMATGVGAMAFVVAGWALPGLSVHAVARPTFVTMTVTDVSRATGRGFRRSCGNEIRFAPVLAGGGRLCLKSPRAHELEGATLEMIGRGNALATKVSAITAVHPGLLPP